MPYARLDGNYRDSSLWVHGLEMGGLFPLLLSMSDCEGIVYTSAVSLAAIGRTTPARIRELLDILASPDPDDRSGTDEGRRIRILDNPWRIQIINYVVYAAKDHTAAARQARYRARLQAARAAQRDGSECHVTRDGDVTRRDVTHVAVSVAVPATDVGGVTTPPTTPTGELALTPSEAGPASSDPIERYVQVFNRVTGRNVTCSSEVRKAWRRALKGGARPEELVVQPLLHAQLNKGRREPIDLQPDYLLRDGSTGTHNWIGQGLRAADGMVLRGALAVAAKDLSVERELLALGVRIEE